MDAPPGEGVILKRLQKNLHHLFLQQAFSSKLQLFPLGMFLSVPNGGRIDCLCLVLLRDEENNVQPHNIFGENAVFAMIDFSVMRGKNINHKAHLNWQILVST